MRERAFQGRENVIYYTLSLFSCGGTGRHSRCFLSLGYQGQKVENPMQACLQEDF